MNNFGIYVHIPFCACKCKYCSFVSCPLAKIDNIAVYFENLKKQIGYFSSRTQKCVTSIFFGGGTPSSVDEKYITDTLDFIKKKFKVKKNAEISIECNPNSASSKKLTAYKNAGFNRLSVGVQSFDDETLKKIGRVHNLAQVFSALKNAQKIGFKNINIDLILGINKININFFEKNIKKIINYGVKHISAYMLILEKGTVLFDEVNNNLAQILSADDSVDEYEKVLKILKKYKINRYEVSNFSMKNYECKHNLNYWNAGEYLGFGASAHSYFDGERFASSERISDFFVENFDPKCVMQNVKKLTTIDKIEEYIMLSLRTKNGINLDYLKDKFNYDLLQEKNAEINYLLKNKIIFIKNNKKIINFNKKIIKNNYLSVKNKYFGVLDQIILKLI